MADLITCLRCDGKGYVTFLARKGTHPCPKCHSCGKIEGTFNLPTDVVRYFEQSARFRPETLWNDLWGSPQRTPVPNTAQELAALRDQVKTLGERLEVLEAPRPIPAVAPAPTISSEPWEAQNLGVAAEAVPALQAQIDKAVVAQNPGVAATEVPALQEQIEAIAERDEARKAFDDAYSSLGQAVAERDEAREDRDSAMLALDHIWDVFPPTSDADNGDDDISHEPLIRRARMAADKLTAARAEVRGLHATLDQLRAELDKAASEEARLRKGWGDLIQLVAIINTALDQAGVPSDKSTVLRVKALADERDRLLAAFAEVSAERDEALAKAANARWTTEP